MMPIKNWINRGTVFAAIMVIMLVASWKAGVAQEVSPSDVMQLGSDQLSISEMKEVAKSNEEAIINEDVNPGIVDNGLWSRFMRWIGLEDTPEEIMQKKTAAIEDQVLNQDYPEITQATLITVDRYGESYTDSETHWEPQCSSETWTATEQDVNATVNVGDQITKWIGCDVTNEFDVHPIVDSWQEIVYQNQVTIIDGSKEWCYDDLDNNQIVCKSIQRCDGWLHTDTPPVPGCLYRTIPMIGSVEWEQHGDQDIAIEPLSTKNEQLNKRENLNRILPQEAIAWA